MRILIDGDYAHDRQGTGISTYARMLAKGLHALGHDISWISGATAGSKADALADAAAVFDEPQAARGPRAWLQTAGRVARGLSSGHINAREIRRDVVMAQSAATDQPVYLAPELFVRAHYRHMMLRQFTEVRIKSRVDVLHLTAPLPVRMKGVKQVVTIHDLIPLRLPHTTGDNKSEFSARARQCANQSDLVITVSTASKNDIVALLDIDPAKVVVTYQPSDLTPPSPAELEGLPTRLFRFGLTPGEYLLCVGAQEPKKNIRRLIEAYLDIDTSMPLVLAGPKGWLWEKEVGAALAPLSEKARARIKFTGFVEREDLRRLYAGACAFVYPSLYEGFGLPALEAMICGCPVVTSNTSSLPEVCAEAAVCVDPFERESIRAGIEQLIGDPSLRERLAGMGREQAKRFSFEAYEAALGEAYSRLVL